LTSIAKTLRDKGKTYELLHQIFGMEKLNNCDLRFFVS